MRQMEEYARRRQQARVGEDSNDKRSPSELAKIWFVILLALLIALYFIVELLSLIFNMILFIAFRVIAPIFGVYILFNFFNVGRILPQVSEDTTLRVHRLLLRSVSWSEKLTDAVEKIFD